MRQFTNLSQSTQLNTALNTDLNDGTGSDDGVLPSRSQSTKSKTANKSVPLKSVSLQPLRQTPRSYTSISQALDDSKFSSGSRNTQSSGSKRVINSRVASQLNQLTQNVGLRPDASNVNFDRPRQAATAPQETQSEVTLEEVLPTVEFTEQPMEYTVQPIEETEIKVLPFVEGSTESTESTESAEDKNYLPWIVGGVAGLLAIGVAVYAVRSK